MKKWEELKKRNKKVKGRKKRKGSFISLVPLFTVTLFISPNRSVRSHTKVCMRSGNSLLKHLYHAAEPTAKHAHTWEAIFRFGL